MKNTLIIVLFCLCAHVALQASQKPKTKIPDVLQAQYSRLLKRLDAEQPALPELHAQALDLIDRLTPFDADVEIKALQERLPQHQLNNAERDLVKFLESSIIVDDLARHTTESDATGDTKRKINHALDKELLAAVKAHDTDEVERLLSLPEPPSVNISDDEGRTLIMYAVAHQLRDIIELLKNAGQGLSLNAPSSITKNRRSNILPSEPQGPMPKPEEIKTFFEEAENGSWSVPRYWLGKKYVHPTVFKLIKKYGKNIINMHNPAQVSGPYHVADGTVLVIAATCTFNWSDKEFEELLKVPGIDINLQVNEPYSDRTNPLMNAVRSEDIGKVKLLLKYGADPDYFNDDGYTPLILAASKDDPAMVKSLLQAGASTQGVYGNVFSTDYGKTFLELADEHPEVKKVIDEHRKVLAQQTRSAQKISENTMEDISRGSTAAGNINQIIAGYAEPTFHEAQAIYRQEIKDSQARNLQRAQELNRRIKEIKSTGKVG